MDKKRSVKILKGILKKVEKMPLEEKTKISNEMNEYVEKIYNFGNKMKGKVEK
jgi:hypothetical protein